MTDMSTPMALDATFIQDPYSLYRRLRVEAPVTEAVMPRGLKVWLVTRYADARDALANPALHKNMRDAQHLFKHHQTKTSTGGFGADLTAHMLNSDPPDHTRLRKLVAKAFTMRRVELLRPRIEEITETLLDNMSEEVDLVNDYAFPIPVTVICELLGVPQADQDDFREWSTALVSAVSAESVRTASASMAAYLRALVETKRAAPTDDMLSTLIQPQDDGDELTEIELVSMAFLLLVAGHETTVNLIANGVLSLLQNPAQLKTLIATPALLPGAIEEFLRYESPINHATLRYTTEPTEIGDKTIQAGEFVLIALTSANHDKTRFGAEAETLDITRPPGGHLSFGHGIHFCLGAPLARLEGQIAIGRLITRFPNLILKTEANNLRWRNSTLLRGLETLPIHVG